MARENSEKRRNTLKVTFSCLILFKVEFEREEVELEGKAASRAHPAHGIRPCAAHFLPWATRRQTVSLGMRYLFYRLHNQCFCSYLSPIVVYFVKMRNWYNGKKFRSVKIDKSGTH